MRNALICLNVLLAAALAYCAVSWMSGGETPEGAPSARTEHRATTQKGRSKAASKEKEAEKKPLPRGDREGVVARLAERNIFDPSRCAGARVPGAQQSQKLDMRLVGTFTVGDVSGAIILQKQAQQCQMGGRRTPPGYQEMMQAQQQQAAQQDRMTRLLQQLVDDSREERENRRDWEERFRNRNNPNWRPPERTAAQRRDERDARRRQRERNWRNRNSSSSPSVYYKQYVRCGETTSNGYTLVSVTRTSATLTRGSEKVELVLLDASENANGRAFANAEAAADPPFFMGPPPPGGFPGGPGGGPGGMRGGPQNNGGPNQAAPSFNNRNQSAAGGAGRTSTRGRRDRNQ